MALEVTDRQRRWLSALLVLSTIAVGFIVLGYLGQLFLFFGDILLVFFLAWLLAFVLSPAVGAVLRLLPVLPRAIAVVLVYGVLLGGLLFLVVGIAGNLAVSISQFVEQTPQLRQDLPTILAPWQARLDAIGLEQVDLTAQSLLLLDNVDRYASELVEPLQQIAVASLGVIGNLLFVLILSLYMVADRDRIVSFLFRIVPPGFTDEARLLETSVASSFAGFLRGQALMGVIYAAVAFVASAAFELPFLPVTTAASGLLQAIPFFGPFLSWLPPVLVAILFVPDAVLPTLVVMGIGWFVVMNVLQPRLMSDAVGIHPIVVLGSVLIGAKLLGIPGAIFGIPIAAVLSAFFFHYLSRTRRETGTVAVRAARRIEAREGREVRVPREPTPDDVADGGAPADAADDAAVDAGSAAVEPGSKAREARA